MTGKEPSIKIDKRRYRKVQFIIGGLSLVVCTYFFLDFRNWALIIIFGVTSTGFFASGFFRTDKYLGVAMIAFPILTVLVEREVFSQPEPVRSIAIIKLCVIVLFGVWVIFRSKSDPVS